MNSYISLLITSVCYFLGNANGYCTDILGHKIREGGTFSPGKNPCEMCLCTTSKAMDCQIKECIAPPPKACKNYVAGNECCEFICQDPNENRGSKTFTQKDHFLGPGFYVHLKLFGKQLVEEIKRYYYAKPKDVN